MLKYYTRSEARVLYVDIYNEYFQNNMDIMIFGKQSAIWVLSICVAIENE